MYLCFNVQEVGLHIGKQILPSTLDDWSALTIISSADLTITSCCQYKITIKDYIE